MDRTEQAKSRKVWLIAGLSYNFMWLFLFKYLDFFSQNVNQLFHMAGSGMELPYLHLVLPIGISFYTFQISSYLIDVYWKKVPAEGSVLNLGTYLCMFPQLIAGPIAVTEFWRRWHMTLGGWFREYVYIPLGGNRRHLIRTLFVVWTLTGLWHGASWNFVLWGFSIFVLICLEKKGLGRFLESRPAFGHLSMLFVIPLSWLLFAVTDLSQIGIYLQRLFPFLPGETTAVYQWDFIKYGTSYGLSLIAGLFCCTKLPRRWYQKHKYGLVVSETQIWPCRRAFSGSGLLGLCLLYVPGAG